MAMGIMAIPNIIALFLLSKDVKNTLDDYDAKVKAGNVYWDYEFQDLEEKEGKKASVLKKGFVQQ